VHTIDDDDVAYVVESVPAKRPGGGKRQFLVRWQGYDASHDTWEDEANILDPALLRSFDGGRTTQLA